MRLSFCRFGTPWRKPQDLALICLLCGGCAFSAVANINAMVSGVIQKGIGKLGLQLLNFIQLV
jgi:hypothetical protein